MYICPWHRPGDTLHCGVRVFSDSFWASGLGSWICFQTNSCPAGGPFQVPISLAPLAFTLTSRQPQNSDHSTLEASCQSSSRASFLQLIQRVTVHPVQIDMRSVFTYTEHMQHRWLLLTFDLGQGYSTAHLALPPPRLLRCFSPFTIDQDRECHPLFQSPFLPRRIKLCHFSWFRPSPQARGAQPVMIIINLEVKTVKHTYLFLSLLTVQRFGHFVHHMSY